MAKHQLTETQIAEYTRVAYYYYIEGATQEQIAARMKMSRQRVNRILSECLNQGIVQITIRNLESIHLELESRIKQKYGLHDIRVVDSTGNEDDLYRDLGIAGGKYLATILQDGDIVGFTRGRTLASLAEHMPAIHKKNLTAVQLLGSRNQEHQNTAANAIVHNISKRMGANHCMLFAPIFVSSAELKKSLWQDPIFEETYNVIKSCDIAVVGIGTSESIRFFSALTGEPEGDITDVVEGQEVIGEVGTHLYGQNGAAIPNRQRDRIIAVELHDYFQIPVRIGIAGSTKKARAIHSAILGKYVNVLITDYETATIIEAL